MAPVVVKGNRREVPGGLTPLDWWELVRVVEAGSLDWVPWYDPAFEHLSPDELQRFRAKAVVWHQEVGDWPGDTATWWEVRECRRRGDMPHTDEPASAEHNDRGDLVCGHCGAQWSANHDGSLGPSRCGLCDRILQVAL